MGEGVYEVGTAAGVRAFHVMPGMEGPEGELHAHDYRIELVVRRGELSPEGWVCDLDVLDAALGEITHRLEGSDLEAIRPAEAEAVTVEVFARWVHHTLSAPVAGAGGETLAVRVWESPVAFGGFAGPVGQAPAASSP
jgi:6-pyruvoyltetrahydropterin/6-carboxytetrahydropterin synthase